MNHKRLDCRKAIPYHIKYDNADLKMEEVMLKESKDVEVGVGKNLRVSGVL